MKSKKNETPENNEVKNNRIDDSYWAWCEEMAKWEIYPDYLFLDDDAYVSHSHRTDGTLNDESEKQSE